MKKIHRFLVQENLDKTNIVIENVDLVHILRNVLKFEVGESCILFSDSSDDYLSEITQIEKNNISFKLISKIPKKNVPHNITACISISKRNTFELVVQKLTEIGVYRIIPVISDRTIKNSINLERLQKISNEALEQSGGSKVVQISEPVSLKESLEVTKDLKCIYFDIEGSVYNKGTENVECFYIGPEGGWSEEDKSMFADYQINSYKLGDMVMRTETASIVCGFKLIWD